MKITRIETIPVDVPINADTRHHGGGGAPRPLRSCCSKSTPMKGSQDSAKCRYAAWSGEDQVTAAHFIDTILGPRLWGASDAHRATHPHLRRAVAANPFTKAAVEMALWDILGKVAGLPVYRYWAAPCATSCRRSFRSLDKSPGGREGCRVAVEQVSER